MIEKKNLPSRSKVCSGHGAAFVEGGDYISLLQPEEEGFRRSDYCLRCWESLSNEQSLGHHWKGKIPQKEAKKLTADEKALALFRTLCQEPTAHKERLFLLALYLERRRQLARQVKEGKEWICEIPETGEIFALSDTSFSPEEIERATSELATCLDG